jgi:hypothetical protein
MKTLPSSTIVWTDSVCFSDIMLNILRMEGIDGFE